MKVAGYIQNKLDRLARGDVFTYEEFIKKVSQKEAIKALNRMAENGASESFQKDDSIGQKLRFLAN